MATGVGQNSIRPFTQCASRGKPSPQYLGASSAWPPHTQQPTAQSGDRDPDVRTRLKAIETAILALVTGADSKFKAPLKTPRPKSGEICNLWNENQCSYGDECRYTHICTECKGEHQALHCPLRSSLPPARGSYARGSRSVSQPAVRGSGLRRGYRARDLANLY